MLTFKHISQSIDATLKLIDGRRKGLIKSLKTSLNKVNNITLNGFEWNRIITIAGRSGSGKSIYVEQLKRDFCDMNEDQKFSILSFEFEMLATDQVARSISGKTGKSTKYLYSGERNTITDSEFRDIENVTYSMRDYPIYYVDQSGTPDEIEETIKRYVELKKLKENKEGLVVTIDHVLLTKGKQTDNEKGIIDQLCKKMIEVKKWFEAQDMNIIIVLVSQLNREIDQPERRTNPKLHYPNRTDIFAASSLFFASDYLFVIHKPASIDGITKREGYGANKLPVFNPQNEDQPMIYMHVLKERHGQPCILQLLDNFRESRIDEYFSDKNKLKKDD